MTPAGAMAMLDGQLGQHGQTVTLKRGTDTATVKALVRGVKLDELVGDVRQGDRTVVLSPTGLGSFPLPIGQGDKVVLLDGTVLNVETADPVVLADALVRINLVVRGS